MDFLNKLPKPLIFSSVITLGIIFLIINNPPSSICSVQIDHYKKKNVGFIFKDSQDKVRTQTILSEKIQECVRTNTPGGCYSLFSKLRQFVKSFNIINTDCHHEISEIKQVRKYLVDIYSLFIIISWGKGEKNEFSNSLNWLSINDVSLFCRVKNKINYFYGSTYLTRLEGQLLQELDPGKSLEEFQKLTILSENCSFYP